MENNLNGVAQAIVEKAALVSEDYKFLIEGFDRGLSFLAQNRELGICETVCTPSPETVENDFEQLCLAYNIPLHKIDCRKIVSHDDFCKEMRQVPEYSAIMLSHVTEIPCSPEQKYIGWAINSLKNPLFFDIYPMENMFCLLTCLPDNIVAEPFHGALHPMPGGYVEYAEEWKRIIK